MHAKPLVWFAVCLLFASASVASHFSLYKPLSPLKRLTMDMYLLFRFLISAVWAVFVATTSLMAAECHPKVLFQPSKDFVKWRISVIEGLGDGLAAFSILSVLNVATFALYAVLFFEWIFHLHMMKNFDPTAWKWNEYRYGSFPYDIGMTCFCCWFLVVLLTNYVAIVLMGLQDVMSYEEDDDCSFCGNDDDWDTGWSNGGWIVPVCSYISPVIISAGLRFVTCQCSEEISIRQSLGLPFTLTETWIGFALDGFGVNLGVFGLSRAAVDILHYFIDEWDCCAGSDTNQEGTASNDA